MRGPPAARPAPPSTEEPGSGAPAARPTPVNPIALAAALQLVAAEAPPARPPRPAPDVTPGASATVDEASLPPEQRERYALVRQKCTKCHPLSVAISRPLGSAGWRRHAKRPGAALSEAQVRSVAEFLRFHAARRRAP